MYSYDVLSLKNLNRKKKLSCFRLLVAALHSNENAQRSQALKRDGTPRYRLSYPKAKKGEHCLKVVKEGCTYGKVAMN